MAEQAIERRRTRFIRFLKEKLFLRFHMSLILGGTVLSGVATSKILLLLHVKAMYLRYPVAIAVAYLVFFGLMKLWLLYIASHAQGRESGKRSSGSGQQNILGDTADSLSGLPDLSFDGPSLPSASFRGGGGDFGGGGASGSYSDAGDAVTESLSSSAKGGSGTGGSFDLDVDLDDAVFVLIALVVLLAAIFGAAFYLIYQAPAILSEAAFNFFLATSLAKRARKMDEPDWVGSVFRATWIPFFIIMALSAVAGAVFHKFYPGATKLSEIIRLLIADLL
jgi:hypothetical protein